MPFFSAQHHRKLHRGRTPEDCGPSIGDPAGYGRIYASSPPPDAAAGSDAPCSATRQPARPDGALRPRDAARALVGTLQPRGRQHRLPAEGYLGEARSRSPISAGARASASPRSSRQAQLPCRPGARPWLSWSLPRQLTCYLPDRSVGSPLVARNNAPNHCRHGRTLSTDLRRHSI